jgi:hypothetical protein
MLLFLLNQSPLLQSPLLSQHHEPQLLTECFVLKFCLSFILLRNFKGLIVQPCRILTLLPPLFKCERTVRIPFRINTSSDGTQIFLNQLSEFRRIRWGRLCTSHWLIIAGRKRVSATPRHNEFISYNWPMSCHVNDLTAPVRRNGQGHQRFG